MLVLLDRDGVINEDLASGVLSPDALRLIPGSARAIAALNEAGIAVAVVTNQSAVGRGIISAAALDAIHAQLRRLLKEEGAQIDAIYAATDHPDRATPRRKPGDAMLREAISDFGARAQETPMIGDALRDLQAAASAGCERILVRTGKGAATLAAGLPETVQPVAVYADLAAAVKSLLHRAASQAKA